jgi:hypothetical protein
MKVTLRIDGNGLITNGEVSGMRTWRGGAA